MNTVHGESGAHEQRSRQIVGGQTDSVSYSSRRGNKARRATMASREKLSSNAGQATLRKGAVSQGATDASNLWSIIRNGGLR